MEISTLMMVMKWNPARRKYCRRNATQMQRRERHKWLEAR